MGIGPVVIGSALPDAGILRLREVIEPTEGEDQVWHEVALDCEAHIFVEIGDNVVRRIVVRDNRPADSSGISVGMRFQEVVANLNEREVLGGEEEGRYLTVRSRGIGYLFTTDNLPLGALADIDKSRIDLSHQRLTEILVPLP